MSDIYVIEEFHPFPEELRRYALTQEFVDWDAPDGETYKRVFIGDVPGIVPMLHDLFGPCQILGTGFRLNYNEEVPNHAIHTDLGWGTHALVLYLSEGGSGTAFWEHIPTKLDRIVEKDRWMSQLDIFDWDNQSTWNQTRLVKEKFNRAVIYKSDLFHSRYQFKAYGNDPRTGRLIAVAFFTPERA
jgi:Family of unknown function (DUF6445)